MKRFLAVLFVIAFVAGFLNATPSIVWYDAETGIWSSNTNAGGSTNILSAVVTSNLAYTVQLGDAWIIMVSTNAFTLTNTLPTAVGFAGQRHHIASATNSTMDAVVDANGSELINNASTFTLKKQEAISIVSDGANWLIY